MNNSSDPGGRRRTAARRKLNPNEARATNKSGLWHLAIRTHKEVGEILGLTASRVQQIERDALFKLRKALSKDNPFV